MECDVSDCVKPILAETLMSAAASERKETNHTVTITASFRGDVSSVSGDLPLVYPASADFDRRCCILMFTSRGEEE